MSVAVEVCRLYEAVLILGSVRVFALFALKF